MSDCIRENMPTRFLPGFAEIQAKLATLNPGGAPSRLGQVNSPVHGLSAGGLLGASCEKQGRGEGVLYVHLPLV